MTDKSTPIVDQDLIRRRIEDWQNRTDNLYSEIEDWIKDAPNYSFRLGNSLEFYEELMQKFDVPPYTLKSADIFKDEILAVSIKPKGLWVIGANGRLDLLTDGVRYFLLDFAQAFEEPNWTVVSSNRRTDRKKFDKDFLLGILDS